MKNNDKKNIRNKSDSMRSSRVVDGGVRVVGSGKKHVRKRVGSILSGSPKKMSKLNINKIRPKRVGIIKFSSQANPALLLEVRAIAEAEGRKFQAVIDEALRDLVEKKRNSNARPHVLSAFEQIAKKRNWLYTQLAK